MNLGLVPIACYNLKMSYLCLRCSYSISYGFGTGVGGAFLMTGSKVKQHVMPDFSSTPLDTEKKIDSWLRFYNMAPPLVAVGTFVTNDPVRMTLK